MACTINLEIDHLSIDLLLEKLIINTGIEIEVETSKEKGYYCFLLNPIGNFRFGLDPLLIKNRDLEYKIISTREGYLLYETINIINEMLGMNLYLPPKFKSTKYNDLSFFNKIKFR